MDTSLAALVRSAVANLGNLAARQGLRIVTEMMDDLPLVRADERRIVQVLSNLLSNAVKFSPAGGDIIVALRSESGGVRVEIRDPGIGIAEEDLPKLFTRFRQLNASSTRTAGGTGLGLVISRGIVEEHGGTLHVASTPGAGSVFSFWLPGATVPEETRETPLIPAPPRHTAPANHAGG